MARLDVYPTPGKSGVGYVVDVQADILSGLATRVVVPLIPESALSIIAQDLNPVFVIEGARHVLLTQAIATVPRRELRHGVASLLEYRDIVLRALDILLTGI
jgi:toxin CcdB